MNQPLKIACDERTGLVRSVRLYDAELLDAQCPCAAELLVNGLPLKTRLHQPADASESLARWARLKGERFVDHFAGWGLVIARSMGVRTNLEHPCLGIQYVIRREQADLCDLPCPGPGGPVIEAPLYVDTFALLNWNWGFWGDDTRMIFPSAHSSGPSDEFGHVGYEHDTPETCKRFLQNVWRRIYPGVMVIHGGVFYNQRTGHWLAITCRRPHVGYILNIASAGRGVAYDFTLHAPFGLGDSLTLPEIKIYYGPDHETMMRFMADYVTFHYEEPPAWVFKTLWREGLAWDNQPTWAAQADAWERQLATGEASAISYSLVTNRPVLSGTTPTGYEPDPNHGTVDDFRRMCRRLTDKGVPLLIWMSHSGLMYRGGADIDDDWFIRGIDGRICAAWGNADKPELAHINPGHPGYIEYTKKWIRFYMRECGAKGIFFDCLGWAFPPDFRPRAFMRYPGDTNRMAIRFIEEIFACVKACDPEGLCFGEGTTFDAPVNAVSLNHNPVRAIDGWGPRDFLLQLNRSSRKRIVLDQGPAFAAAAGMVRAVARPGFEARNRCLAKLLAEHGGRDAFTHVPGDVSVLAAAKLVVVPDTNATGRCPLFRLPAPWHETTVLIEETDGSRIAAGPDGAFRDAPTGIYRIS
jgi:hypothetical protein